MPNNTDIQIRSEEVQDILTSVPNWMIRWGNSLILLLLVLFILMSWFIKYPDIINTEVIVTTEIPPEKVYAKSNGKFDAFFVKDNDSVKRKHRVIVGAYKTQTPEFHATMKRMITNPFWHVPYSISSTEILYNARKDSNYFNRRGYKVFKSGEQVDPAGVNWSAIGENNFPYRIRQNGGGGNS